YRDQIDLAQFQLSLQGEDTREIAKQVELKRQLQAINRRDPNASPEAKAQLIGMVEEWQKYNDEVVLAQEAQQRISDSVKQIAGEIENTLAGSIKTAFERTPAEAGLAIRHFWQNLRDEIRQTLGSIVSSLSEAAFIKPALGTLVSAINPEAGRQLGTFGTGGTPGNGIAQALANGTPATVGTGGLSNQTIA